MTHSIQRLLMLVMLLVFAAPATVHAQADSDATQADEPVRSISDWNLPKRGEKLAIKGYDPVAYFPEGGGKATKGKKSIIAAYDGVVYRFASDANRRRFLANPSRYEPAYGGWCSWAMRDGDQVKINPKSFIVKDDRLFLFYDGLLGNTRKEWRGVAHDDAADLADRMWERMSGETSRAVPVDG